MSLSRTGAGVAAIALSGLAVLGVQAPASAAPGDCPADSTYRPSGGCVGNDLAADQRTYAPGEAGQITAAGFQAGSAATLSVESTPTFLKNVTASQAGIVDASFTLPSSIPAGQHHLVLSGTAADGSPLRLSYAITVAGRAAAGTTTSSTNSTSAGGSQLPRTGTEVGLVAVTGLALVGAGVGAVYAGRRRRQVA